MLAQQLLQLRWPRPSQRRHGESRLRELFHAGWLDRIPYQDCLAGRARALYVLGPLGRRYVAEQLGVPVDTVAPRPARQRERESLFVRHHLSTVQAVINLRLAAEAVGGGMPFFQAERELRARHYKDKRSFPVVPDAFVALAADGGVQTFCVELDRNTVPLRAWAERIEAYWRWRSSSSYQSELQRPAVLTFVDASPSEAEGRARALRATAERTLPNVADVASMFWFATLEAATVEAALQGAIWRSPNIVRARTLLE